jgi:hypothetical protein
MSTSGNEQQLYQLNMFFLDLPSVSNARLCDVSPFKDKNVHPAMVAAA